MRPEHPGVVAQIQSGTSLALRYELDVYHLGFIGAVSSRSEKHVGIRGTFGSKRIGEVIVITYDVTFYPYAALSVGNLAGTLRIEYAYISHRVGVSLRTCAGKVADRGIRLVGSSPPP